MTKTIATKTTNGRRNRRMTKTDEQWAKRHETDRAWEERAAKLRGNATLPAEAIIVKELIELCVEHDKLLQFLNVCMYKGLGLRAPADGEYVHVDDAMLNWYRYELIGFCAAVTPAAAALVAGMNPVLLRAFAEFADEGSLGEHIRGEIEQFIRSIFEESGIGPRFDPRLSHEVYPYAKRGRRAA